MRVDAITLEVFNHRLSAIAEEMGVALCRSAFSPNIKERRDFSCALFDARGRDGGAGGAHPRAPRLDAAVGAGGDCPDADGARRRGHAQRSVRRRHASAGRHGRWRRCFSPATRRTVRVRRQPGASRRHRRRRPRLDAVGDRDLPGGLPPAAGALGGARRASSTMCCASSWPTRAWPTSGAAICWRSSRRCVSACGAMRELVARAGRAGDGRGHGGAAGLLGALHVGGAAPACRAASIAPKTGWTTTAPAAERIPIRVSMRIGGRPRRWSTSPARRHRCAVGSTPTTR